MDWKTEMVSLIIHAGILYEQRLQILATLSAVESGLIMRLLPRTIAN